jgi:hypothetical protein
MTSSHLPPPPEGFQSPILWGTPEHVTELFDGTGIEFGFEDAEVRWDWDSVDQVTEFFETKFGPVIMAKRALEPEGKWEALRDEMRALFAEDEADDGTVSYPGEYLVCTGSKAG